MAICTHTGITIPECSCSACLEAQIRQHRPSAAAGQIRITRTSASPRARRDQRRAA